VVKRSYYKDLVILGCGACATFLMISLISFNAADPSWFFSSSTPSLVTNKCGVLGAWCSSLLIYLFGSWAFLIPCLLLMSGFTLGLPGLWYAAWDCFIALGMMVPLGTALTALHCYDPYSKVVPGGKCGYSISLILERWFDRMGSFLILYTLVLACLTILFQISWITLFEQVQHFTNVIRRSLGRLLSARKRTVYADRLKQARLALFALIAKIRRAKVHPELEPDLEYLFNEQMMLHDETFWQRYQASEKTSPHALEESAAIILSKPLKERESGEELETAKPYQLPDTALFDAKEYKTDDRKITEEFKERARILEEKLERFGVHGLVKTIKPGPVVTLFEYEPQSDTKLSKIVSLEDDLAMALQALSIRIIAPIPGTNVVGFEVANAHRKQVNLATLMQSTAFKHFSGSLPLVLGEDTIGAHVIVDLAKMPHLLIAGSTGAGKSVALNTMLITLLCSRTPEELKLILIDPKRLEFAAYADIAHLLFPLITDTRKALPALQWVVTTMEQRYTTMASAGVRNIFEYHQKAAENKQVMPFIVMVIDELADLMMTAGKEVEELLTRLSQMARAAGIHLLVATQRPSVDVITGLIKVNFPSRIAFKVTSKVDSRTILDCIGADKLLGRGDMLFLNSQNSILQRVHGAYVSDKEIARITTHIKAQASVVYINLDQVVQDSKELLLEDDDMLYQDVIDFLHETDEISISLLQRRFRIGYNRSARIIDALEAQGRIMAVDGSKMRKVIR
jgi:S-DNA-T family DNA segregation ATPase FtsK/SpoIIIE